MENVVIVIQVAKNIIVSGCLLDFGRGSESLPLNASLTYKK